MKKLQFLLVLLVLALPVSSAFAGNTLVVGADDQTFIDGVVAGLQATGDFSSVGSFNAISATPTLSDLQAYSSVYVFTDYTPADPTGLGNVLAQYVDGGGHVTLSTYALSSPWAVQGNIMSSGYSPLLNVGVNGDVTGNVVATMPDPVFNGVNLSNVTFSHNGNYSHPGLDSGATLLATDGNGVDMLARNSAGDVYALNLWPYPYEASADTYQLIANTLIAPSVSTPEPSSLVLLAGGLLGLTSLRRKLTK